MNMMVMLVVLSVVLFTALFFMCYYKEKMKHHPIMNTLFVVASAAFFFAWNYAAFERGWLKDGFMTLENISPFICTVILLTPFMQEKIRDLAYCAIAFLSFGMFLAMYVSPFAEYFFNFQQNATFIHIAEQACHLIMALYGFYLFLVGRVKVNLKSFLKAIAFVYSAVAFGVFLNWCFHLANFGMNMYGKYSIYFLDIFGSFEATLIAYLLGILGVLTLGFLTGHFLEWVSTPSVKKTKPSKTDNANVTDEIPTDAVTETTADTDQDVAETVKIQE